MAEPFLGEIRIFSFNFPPKGWAQCNGQLLPISQNPALFSLLGTTYGGNGQTTFGLPNQQGRTPVHTGNGIQLGQAAGEQAHTLTLGELPAHTHAVSVLGVAATASNPSGTRVLARSAGAAAYGAAANLVAMAANALGSSGGSQAHVNMQPYLTLNFCIALQGIFPSQN